MFKIATMIAITSAAIALSASSANAQKNAHNNFVNVNNAQNNTNQAVAYTLRGQWRTRGSNGIQHQLTLNGSGFRLNKVSRTQGTVRKRGGSWKSSPIQNRQFTLQLNYGNGQTETLTGIFGPRGNAIKMTSSIDGSVWVLKRR